MYRVTTATFYLNWCQSCLVFLCLILNSMAKGFHPNPFPKLLSNCGSKIMRLIFKNWNSTGVIVEKNVSTKSTKFDLKKFKKSKNNHLRQNCRKNWSTLAKLGTLSAKILQGSCKTLVWLYVIMQGLLQDSYQINVNLAGFLADNRCSYKILTRKPSTL